MGLVATMARVALKHAFGDSNDGKNSLIARSHGMATRIAKLWLRSGGKLLGPTESCMVFLDIKDAEISVTELEILALEHGLVIKLQRLVVHYRQYLLGRDNPTLTCFAEISEEAIHRIENLFRNIAVRKCERREKIRK